MQRIRAQAARQVEHVRQLMRVVPRDRGVDLHRNADLLQVAHAINCRVEGAGNSAEGVVRGCVGTVDRNRYSLDAGVLDFLGNVFGDQRAVGRQRRADAATGGVLSQLKNVVTVQRLAAAQHQDRVGELGDLRNDVQRFAGGQVGRRHQLSRSGAAVDAAQIAALGDLPEDQPRFVFFLARRMILRGMRAARYRCHDCYFLPAPCGTANGSFLCFQDRISTTQAAVSGVTGGCDVCHSEEMAVDQEPGVSPELWATAMLWRLSKCA